MPEKHTIRRARQDRREGKSPSTQAGEFVHEEIAHIRAGKHGARSAKQAIAIGLSKARRAGVDLPPPRKGEASEETRRKARRDVAAGSRTAAASKTAGKTAKATARKTATKAAVPKRAAAKRTAVKRPAARKASAGTTSTAAPSRTRSRATTRALKREEGAAASPLALSRQAKKAARKRTAGERSTAAKKAARTKGAEGRSKAARKAARTRARHDGRRRHNGASAHA